jgi:hypothetical protein
VTLFFYSKVAELTDTVLLILAQNQSLRFNGGTIQLFGYIADVRIRLAFLLFFGLQPGTTALILGCTDTLQKRYPSTEN